MDKQETICKDLTGKRIMLLGGVRDACEIINEAHRIGIEVYETDYLIDSPAKKLSDKSFMVSCTDVDAVVDLCKKEHIDGVFTGYTDSLLPSTEEICRKLHVPFWGNAENIDMCINKQLFKIACEKSDVPVVPWKLVNAENYKSELKDIQAPVVFKPVDNSGSRGVFKCYKNEDLIQTCEHSMEYSKSKEILVEKLMDSHNEFSAYYMLYQGKYYFSGMGDRYVYELSKDIAPVGQGMLFPSVRVDRWLTEVDPSIKRFFRDNDMSNGYVFIQGFYENDKFYIHEIGYRLNGGFSFKLVEHLCHYNQVHQLLRYSLTGEMDLEELRKSSPYFNGGLGMVFTITLGKGIIRSIKGVDNVRQLPGVIEFYQMKEVNTELNSEGTTAQVFAYIIISADSSSDLKNLINTIESSLVVEDEHGNNMILPMLEPERLNFYK